MASARHDYAFTLMCPQCRDPHPNIIESHQDGDTICGDCGIILGDRIIDTGSEWRNFSNDGNSAGASDDPSRVGGPTNPLMAGSTDPLETSISSKDGLTGISKELANTQNRINYRQSEKGILKAFRDIQQFSERISLPRSVIDRAKQIYKLADEAKLLRGSGSGVRSIDTFVASSIFLACKQEQVPRTYKEISSLCQVAKKDVWRVCKMILPLMGNEIITVAKVSDFTSRFCGHLALRPEIKRTCVQISNNAIALSSMAGKSPISVASASIYLGSQLHRRTEQPKSVKDISFVSGITEGTIKQCCRDLQPFLKEAIPIEFHQDIPNLLL